MSDFQITLRPSGRFEKFEGVECRLWEGETSKGTPVVAYIPAIRSTVPASDLDDALCEIKVDRHLVSFDARLVT